MGELKAINTKLISEIDFQDIMMIHKKGTSQFQRLTVSSFLELVAPQLILLDEFQAFTFQEQPYDLTAMGLTDSLYVSSEDTVPRGVSINSDGTELFMCGSSSDTIYRYSMSTPYDLTTASLTDSLDISSEETNPRGVSINSDGTELFMCGSSSDTIYRYSMSTAYDLSTASLTDSLDISSEEATPTGVSINSDGTELFMCGTTSDTIYRYSMSTPYDLTTASLTDSLDISSEEDTPGGVSISSDGAELFICGNNHTVYRYTLSAPYDLTTASLTGSLDVSGEDTVPRGVSINSDGTELFVGGTASDTIYRYTASRLYTNSLQSNWIQSKEGSNLTLATEGTKALSIDEDQVVTIGANDLGSGHLHTTDKLVISDGDDSGISIVATDAGTYGAYVALKQVDGTAFENGWYIIRQTNGDGSGNGNVQFIYGTTTDPAAGTVYFSLNEDGGSLNLPGYAGTGTQDAQFTSTGTLTRITSDESTKKIYGKLEAGLDYVLATAKATIEFDYLDENQNAEGFHHWGFGARAATKEAGASPAFREHEGVYHWDRKQMIAPAYNAIAEMYEMFSGKLSEQDKKIESLQKEVEELKNK